MTLEEFMEQHNGFPTYEETWKAGQAAERERIKCRVKEAAESLWCIRNQVGEKPYNLYIGPSLTMLEEFAEKLLEEE